MWSFFEVDSRIVEKDMSLNNYNVIYIYTYIYIYIYVYIYC